jgi:alkylation response protein AidB-like acyl-CoA dehydrogenase
VEAVADGGEWRLFGEKWFCSVADADQFVVTARPRGARAGTAGIGCFLVPRVIAGGTVNDFRLRRLKDKLGTRAMATGEVTLEGAEAELVGELEHGFRQMTPMLNITRLHNAIASAAAMRRALMLARGYAGQRTAFGRTLDRQPLQRQVLLQIAVQAEAALLVTMRLAALLGRIECGLASAEEELLFRAGSSMAKLYTAKLAVAAASEGIEAFGGQGYMEDTGIPRLLRDAQVLPIWEGTTNVLSLDVLRVLGKPGVAEAVLGELDRLSSPSRTAAAELVARVALLDADTAQRFARRLAFTLAEAWVDGLLEEAAGRGRREALVAELWRAKGEPLEGPSDGFELVVDAA